MNMQTAGMFIVEQRTNNLFKIIAITNHCINHPCLLIVSTHRQFAMLEHHGYFIAGRMRLHCLLTDKYRPTGLIR